MCQTIKNSCHNKHRSQYDSYHKVGEREDRVRRWHKATWKLMAIIEVTGVLSLYGYCLSLTHIS